MACTGKLDKEDERGQGTGSVLNDTNLRVIWGYFCGLKFSSRDVVF